MNNIITCLFLILSLVLFWNYAWAAGKDDFDNFFVNLKAILVIRKRVRQKCVILDKVVMLYVQNYIVKAK